MWYEADKRSKCHRKIEKITVVNANASGTCISTWTMAGKITRHGGIKYNFFKTQTLSELHHHKKIQFRRRKNNQQLYLAAVSQEYKKLHRAAAEANKLAKRKENSLHRHYLREACALRRTAILLFGRHEDVACATTVEIKQKRKHPSED